jgi:hypothetical protein
MWAALCGDLFLERLVTLGPINSHAVEFLGPIEQILLPYCPIICRRRRVAHAIDRISSHFAGAHLLRILIGVRRKSPAAPSD